MIDPQSTTHLPRFAFFRGDNNNNNGNNEGSSVNTKAPRGFWSSRSNQLKFVEWAAEQLNISKLDDWYSVTQDQFQRLGGGSLLHSYYGGSLAKALMSLYPDHEWIPWRFCRVPEGFWGDRSNRIRFFEWVGKQLSINTLDDWYKVSQEDILRLGGGGLLSTQYDYSFVRALKDVYPDHEWLPWRFRAVPAGFWRDQANHRRFFDWAAKQLNVRQLDDWYRVSQDDIRDLGGTALLDRYYDFSLVKALSAVYPEHEWLPWRFSNAPRGLWNDPTTHRQFFDWAAKQLGIGQHNLDAWYNVSREDILNLGGATLLETHYDNSLIKALPHIYPEHEWLPWRFAVTSRGFWTDRDNHRRFFDWAAKQLNVREPDDWYNVGMEDMNRIDGSRLLSGYYQNSMLHALSAIYPEREWIPWRFTKAPRGYWKSEENQRHFFDWAAKQLSLRTLDDWYEVSTDDIGRIGGVGILDSYYNGSLQQALAALYPEHNWLPWRFKTVPLGYWKHPANRRKYFDWVGAQLNVRQLDDWYRVSKDDFRRVGGASLLCSYYGNSFVRALLSVYPEHQWDVWRFVNLRVTLGIDELSGPEDSDSMLRRYLDFLAAELNVHQLDDWYRVSMDQVRSLGGYNLIAQYGGLIAVLRRFFPEHDWSEERMRNARGKRATQRTLKMAAQQLFPDEDVFEEYNHPELHFGDSGTTMTFDVWIPSLRLALEYHGEQHYHDIYALGDNPSRQHNRDEEKRAACQRAGITLVPIPYWWNKSIEDVAATIAAARPDLLQLQLPQSSSSPASSSSSSSLLLFAQAAAKGTPIIDASSSPPSSPPQQQQQQQQQQQPHGNSHHHHHNNNNNNKGGTNNE